MTDRQEAIVPLGAPCWVDLRTPDADRAETFYSELFDWAALSRGREFGEFVVFEHGERSVGGMVGGRRESPSANTWATLLRIADAAATAQAVSAAGGRVIQSPTTVPGAGVFGTAVDPGGSVIGFWEPASEGGFETHGVVGAAVWHELHTSAFDQTVAFYQRAFGWTVTLAERDGERSATLEIDGHAWAGIRDVAPLPAEKSDRGWQVYFGCESVEATISAAVALGGRLLRGPEQTPYGRIAVLADPTGVEFRVAETA